MWVVVNVVDPLKKEVVDNRTLLEHLHEAPQKIWRYISETTRIYMAHVLRLMKYFWPKANMSPLVDGVAMECSDEKFAEYLKEVGPVAQKIFDLEKD